VLERLVARLIERLDEEDGDSDFEADPLNEGEPLFDAKSQAEANAFPWCDPNGDREGPAWIERIDQDTRPLPIGVWDGNGEDAEDDDPAEEDDPGGGNIEDEPHDDFGEAEPDDVGGIGLHGLDQRNVTHWGGKWRAE
jgi:hypothetical protein